MHIDDEWKWVDGAPDAWDGTICDEGANEVLDMGDLLGACGLIAVREFAEKIVEAHNKEQG